MALFHAMLHVMLREGLCDLDYTGAHTEGFAGVKDILGDYGPAAAAQICGVKAEDIVQAARWFAAGPTLSFYWQGLNQSSHGSDKNVALINLLVAHRDLSDPAHRAEVARLWGVPAVPERPGKSALEMFDAVHRGEIKALWIVCTNPAHSLPNQAHVRRALERAELVMLQEADRFTDTAPYADVLLPVAAWGEKEGTVTNSERRISRVRRAVPPPEEARPDWQIAADFALRLGQALGKPLAPSLFLYRSAQQVFDEHRETTRGRARFAAAVYAPLAEAVDARYPLHLNTGRLRGQWHGMSRTGTVAQLYNHAQEPLLAMHRDGMARRGIADGDLVRAASRRGELVLPAAAGPEMGAGQVFLPMHWGAGAS